LQFVIYIIMFRRCLVYVFQSPMRRMTGINPVGCGLEFLGISACPFNLATRGWLPTPARAGGFFEEGGDAFLASFELRAGPRWRRPARFWPRSLSMDLARDIAHMALESANSHRGAAAKTRFGGQVLFHRRHAAWSSRHSG